MSGTIPPGWQRVAIGDIGTVVTGATPPTKNAYFFGGPYPFVTPGDLGEGTRVHTAERSLSEAGAARVRLLPRGSVLVTCIGALIGKVGVAEVPLATNQQINAIIPDRNSVSGEFIAQSMTYSRARLERLAGTQAVPIVNKSTLMAFEIVIPPRADQDRIVEILRTWECYSTLQNRAAEQCLLRTRGLYAKVREQLAGVANVRLGSICRPRQWPTPGLGELLSDGYPVFGANGQIGFLDRVTHHSEVIVVGCRGSCGTVLRIPPRSYVTGNAMALDDLATDQVDVGFLFHILNAQGFSEIISGSSQPQITQAAMADYRVPLPDLLTQRAIGAALDAAVYLGAGASKLARLAHQQKRELMTALFSGRIPVSSASQEVEEESTNA